jgi:hypothetical protein
MPIGRNILFSSFMSVHGLMNKGQVDSMILAFCRDPRLDATRGKGCMIYSKRHILCLSIIYMYRNIDHCQEHIVRPVSVLEFTWTTNTIRNIDIKEQCASFYFQLIAE